jgi:ABC-2 type transport system ATP-binding protein
MSSVISTRGLVKRFGRFTALNGLDLEVEQGEVHGFLGPNGSGKSTTIRVLLGLLKADGGHATLLGGDPWRDVVSLHRRIAYVPGDVTLWPSLTGGATIDLLGRLRGGLDEVRRTELMEKFELDPSKRGRAYSKGNRQKVAIVAALSSRAELLILDEPTSGLDPLMEDLFRREILAEKQLGRTILLSSHIMSEVEALADRMSIIRAGRIVDTGSLADLRSQTQTALTAELDLLPVGFGETRGVTDLVTSEIPGGGIRITCNIRSEEVGAAVTTLGAAGIRTLSAAPPSLENVFLQHYRENA